MNPGTQTPTINIIETEEYGYANPEIKRERELDYLFEEEE